MKHTFKPIPVILAAFFAASFSLHAAVVAYYDFGTGAGTYASSDVDSNSTAGSIVFGAGFSGGGNSGISSTSGNPVDSLFLRPANNSTEALAFSGNKYFSITLTPVSGILSFSSLAFDYRRDSATSPGFYALYASTTGSFSSGSHFDINSPAFTVNSSSFTTYNVDLSGVSGLQNISSAVEFRLYFWGATNSTDVFRMDNIILSTAAVPEPTTCTLLISGCLILLVMRRRYSRQISLSLRS